MATLVLNDPDPALGDTVTFTLAGVNDPFPYVEVLVFSPDDPGELLFGQVQKASASFQLGPTQVWQSGPGNGVATAFTMKGHGGKRNELASTDFTVSG